MASTNKIMVSVRVNGSLAEQIGTTRLRLHLGAPATVQDVLGEMERVYPNSAELITIAIPFVAGRHLSEEDPVSAGQEIALLIPVAGG